MHLDDITIGKLRDLLKIFGGGEFDAGVSFPSADVDLGWRIAVLDRGFVMVGHVTDHGNSITIRDAATIRRWGTNNGLGEIAAGGPTKTTILDKSPELLVPKRAVIFLMKAEAAKWGR